MISATRLSLALACVFFIPSAGMAGEQYEGKISDVNVAVWTLPEKDEIAQLSAGDTLKLEIGKPIHLRLFAPRKGNPTGKRQYLKGVWVLKGGEGHVTLSGQDRRKGVVVVEATAVGVGKRARLGFQLLRGVEAPRGLMSGDIAVQIAGRPAPPPSTRPPVRLGVTLYEDTNFRGRSQTFYSDHASFKGTSIGNDKASSIKVPLGCRATLYKDDRFRGNSAVLAQDVPDLGRERVGNDSVSSIQVECLQPRR